MREKSKALVLVKEPKTKEDRSDSILEKSEALRTLVSQVKAFSAQFELFSKRLGITLEDLPESFLPDEEPFIRFPGTDVTIGMQEIIEMMSVLRQGNPLAIMELAEAMAPAMRWMSDFTIPWGEDPDSSRRMRSEQRSIVFAKPKLPPRSLLPILRKRCRMTRVASYRII